MTIIITFFIAFKVAYFTLKQIGIFRHFFHSKSSIIIEQKKILKSFLKSYKKKSMTYINLVFFNCYHHRLKSKLTYFFGKYFGFS
jgi:hypothetical protein